MTLEAAVVASALALLGVVDGAFSGFRASLGHDGLVDHRVADWVGARRGAVAGALALIPSGVVALTAPGDMANLVAGGRALLAVLGVYGAVMASALVGYAVLPWRQRFLASSLLLGPLSLLRAPVVVAGVVAVWAATHAAVPTTVAALAAAGILAVEPILTRAYSRARPERSRRIDLR